MNTINHITFITPTPLPIFINRHHGREVKARDLKSRGATLVGSNPTDGAMFYCGYRLVRQIVKLHEHLSSWLFLS
jgi:hypothetical protein